MISSRGKAVAIRRSDAQNRFDWPVVADRLAALRPDPRLARWLSGIASLIIFGLVLYAVRNVDWTMLRLALSASGLFWLVFLANYFHAPLADTLILGRLWGNPAGLFSTLVRKQIVNAVALPYAGDGLVLAWAHTRNIAGFGAIKDAAILSGIAGSVITFVILLPVWEPLSAALGLSPSSLFASLSLLSAFPLIAIFKRADVFTLADRELCRIGAVHAARFIVNIVLVALCWHLLLPAEPLQSWLMLAAARMVVSRLPLLPNKELALAAVAASMFPERPEVTAIVAVTGLLLTLAHLLVWVGLAARNDKGACRTGDRGMIGTAFTSVLAPMLLLSAAPEQPVGPFSVEMTASAEGLGPAPAADVESDQEIVVTSNGRSTAADPLRAINEKSFEATVAVDDAITRPVALAYARAVPQPVRQGLRNVLDNLAEPVTFINYVLQLKPLSACKTVARFALNSTIGLAGVFDIGKRRPFKLARHRTGLADTLGFYGVKPGAFFYLPLIGPTTVRDIVGGLVDRAFLPFAVRKPFNRASYTIPVGVLSAVDRRGRNDDRIQALRAELDPYQASRRAYLDRRQARIDALKAGGE